MLQWLTKRREVPPSTWEPIDPLLDAREAAPIPHDASAIEASRIRAGDRSYYYWAQKKEEDAAPREEPRLLQKRAPKAQELEEYLTIARYSFEDCKTFVKVYIPLEGVGLLPPSSVQISFGRRTFCCKVLGYKGRNHRFQVPKLTEEIVEEKVGGGCG